MFLPAVILKQGYVCSNLFTLLTSTLTHQLQVKFARGVELIAKTFAALLLFDDESGYSSAKCVFQQPYLAQIIYQMVLSELHAFMFTEAVGVCDLCEYPIRPTNGMYIRLSKDKPMSTYWSAACSNCLMDLDDYEFDQIDSVLLGHFFMKRTPGGIRAHFKKFHNDGILRIDNASCMTDIKCMLARDRVGHHLVKHAEESHTTLGGVHCDVGIVPFSQR